MMKSFLFLICLSFLACCSATTKEQPTGERGYEGRGSDVFGFPSIIELLSKLKSDIKNSVSLVNGDYGVWTIVQSEADHSLWSFTPEEHPAHPSVVKRTPIEKEGQIYINTEASCNAGKSVCDELIDSFIQLNSKIRDSMGGT